MFEELHLCRSAVPRHLDAPFADERARYLTYCAKRGVSQLTLVTNADMLIRGARQLNLSPDVGAGGERLCAAGPSTGDRFSWRATRINMSAFVTSVNWESPRFAQ